MNIENDVHEISAYVISIPASYKSKYRTESSSLERD